MEVYTLVKVFFSAKQETGKRFHLLKKHNFDIVYLHEEGGVFEGDEKFHIEVLENHYNIDFSDKDFKNDIDVCVWGNFQKSRSREIKKITNSCNWSSKV